MTRGPRNLRALAVDVTQLRLPGYVEMTLDPHRTEVPSAIIDATVAFARSLRDDVADAPVAARATARARIACDDPPRRGRRCARMRSGSTRSLRDRERRPRRTAERAAILLNAGAVGRIGPNRLYVEPLRAGFAAKGTLAIRLDLVRHRRQRSAPTGETENAVYHAPRGRRRRGRGALGAARGRARDRRSRGSARAPITRCAPHSRAFRSMRSS